MLGSRQSKVIDLIVQVAAEQMRVVLLYLFVAMRVVGFLAATAPRGRVCPPWRSGCGPEARSEALHRKLTRNDLFHGRAQVKRAERAMTANPTYLSDWKAAFND